MFSKGFQVGVKGVKPPCVLSLSVQLPVPQHGDDQVAGLFEVLVAGHVGRAVDIAGGQGQAQDTDTREGALDVGGVGTAGNRLLDLAFQALLLGGHPQA